MSDNIGRIFGAIGALAALWIIAYWWWEPSHARRISMDTAGPSSAGAAIIEPSNPRIALPGPAAAAPSASPSAPRVAVIPPRFRDYTIRSGDTMESIAEKELGSRRFADALRSANALMDPDRLKAGRTLRIPLDPSNIQGKVPTPDPVSAPAPEPAEYTVKAGDTLSGIAKTRYGSTRFKDLIFQANRDRLSSEDDVREGQKLRMPPKPQ